MKTSGSIIVDENLQNEVTEKNKCLGLVIRKDEGNNRITAKITSWECNRKSSFVCSLDASQFNKPSKRQKFPCITQNKEQREKRESDEGKK